MGHAPDDLQPRRPGQWQTRGEESIGIGGGLRRRRGLIEAIVEASSVDEFVDQEPIGAGNAVSQDFDDVRMAEFAESLHLGAEFSKSLEGVVIELLDGDGGAGGEPGLVDEAEGAVADD